MTTPKRKTSRREALLEHEARDLRIQWQDEIESHAEDVKRYEMQATAAHEALQRACHERDELKSIAANQSVRLNELAKQIEDRVTLQLVTIAHALALKAAG